MFWTTATAAPGLPSMDLYAERMARRLKTIDSTTRISDRPMIVQVIGLPSGHAEGDDRGDPDDQDRQQDPPQLGSCSLAIR